MGSLLIEIPAWLAGSNHLLFNTAQIWRFTRGAQNLRLTKSRPRGIAQLSRWAVKYWVNHGPLHGLYIFFGWGPRAQPKFRSLLPIQVSILPIVTEDYKLTDLQPKWKQNTAQRVRRSGGRKKGSRRIVRHWAAEEAHSSTTHVSALVSTPSSSFSRVNLRYSDIFHTCIRA